MKKIAILIIDMIEEFVKGRLKSPEAEKIVPNIVKLIEKARGKRIPIIHVIDSHLPTDIEIKIWGPHALKGSPETKIIKELEPKTEFEYVLEKRWYSGFRDTGLDTLLRDLEVETLIVTGIHTHICVLHTVADAVYNRYNVIVVKDAVAAFSKEDHEYALKYMEKVYGVKLLTTDEILKELEQVK